MSLIQRFEQGVEGVNRRPRAALIVLALLLAVQISPYFYPTLDGCLYLKTIHDFFHAESLSDFHCYVPPGYPLLITPAFVFGDRPFLAISILQWLMAVSLMLGLYVWARRQFPSMAVLFTAFVMVNTTLWLCYRRPLKDVVSMSLLIWLVNLMHVLLHEGRLKRVVLLTSLISFLTTFLTLIRFSGVTLAVGFSVASLWMAWRREIGWLRAVAMSFMVSTAAAAALGGWVYYDKTWGGGNSYMTEVVNIYTDENTDDGATLEARAAKVEATPPAWLVAYHTALAPLLEPFQPVIRATGRCLLGLVYRVNDVVCLTIPGLWRSSLGANLTFAASAMLFLPLLAMIGIGWWKLVRRKLDVLALTLPVYVLLYSHWVCDQRGGRFMLPMLPVIVACAWYGAGFFLRQRRFAIFGLLLVGHIGQAAAYWLVIDAPRALAVERNWPIADRLIAQIHERPGGVAVADAVASGCLGLVDLDLHHNLYALDKIPGPQVVWVVQPAGEGPIKGYSVRTVDGPVELLCRNLKPRTPPPVATQDRVTDVKLVHNP